MPNLGPLLRQLRAEMQLSQKDLSEILGVKQNTISQYETGSAVPSFIVLVRLYNAAAPGTLKDSLHQYLVTAFQKDFPEHPELARGVIQDVSTSESVLARFPAAKNPRRAEQLKRFASLVSRVAAMPTVDEAVIQILNDWFTLGNSETARVFRDAAEYLRTRLDILAGVDPDEPEHAELMRERGKVARRLAIALLRQADAAEEKARAAPPRKRPKKDSAPSAL